MARPKGNHKVSIHIYVDKEVYDYLSNITDGAQSISSYMLQKSGIVPAYRLWRKQNASPEATPVAMVEARTCANCTELHCDPACTLAHTTY